MIITEQREEVVPVVPSIKTITVVLTPREAELLLALVTRGFWNANTPGTNEYCQFKDMISKRFRSDLEIPLRGDLA